MKTLRKTNRELLEENAALKMRIEELEKSASDRRELEEILRLSESRFRRLAENAHDMIYRMSLPDGRYEYVNPASYKITGYTPQEHYDGSVRVEKVIHPDFLEYFKQQWDNLLKGEMPPYYEYKIIRKNGEERYLYQRNVLICNENNEPIAIEGIVTDVTYLKQAEQELRESKEKYKEIFMGSIQGMYRVTPEGRFINANPAAARILGYDSPEELMNTITDVASQIYAYPEDRLRAMDLMRKHGYIKNFEVQCRHKNGSIVWVLFNARIVRDSKGNILFHEGTSQDINELKKAEEEIRQYRNNLEAMVKERTEALMKIQEDLEVKSKTLEELNAALKVLLQQREEDKKKLEERVLSNVKRLVMPYIEKMKHSRLDPQILNNLNIVEANLNEIISPFLHTIKQLNLTPRETQIASLIKDGKSTKEIAEIIGIATSSVDSCRNSIRTKLGIINKKVNLQSYLQSIK